ncbi:MAG TPA: hypothetical protein VMU89_23405 [Thermomicrobiaceae bacterium]|nr:hypothetical protein [Thermomicrobiaceae bacterium]
MSEPRVLTEDEAFRLLAHLMATAELHTIEPPSYVHRRIVEGLLPFIDAMIRDGDEPSRGWLRGFRRQVDDALAARRTDAAAFEAFLQEAPGEITRELKRRGGRRAGVKEGDGGAARPS